jgi:hypothetical protein
MDLVAGAAVLVGRVGITRFDLAEILSSCYRGAERGARVAECTVLVATLFDEGSTLTMQGFLPGGFLAGDEGSVVVALGASQRRWIERGIRYVTYASEVLMMRNAGLEAIAEIRSAAEDYGLARVSVKAGIGPSQPR